MEHQAPTLNKDRKSDEIVVVITRQEGICAGCKQELLKGAFLRVQDDGVRCMTCAGLGDLEFLPRGDAAVSRRAAKHSPTRAVVVQWSRARKRYERQGILATPQAIEQATQESKADEEARKAKQARAAVKREVVDREFMKAFEAAIMRQFPRIPPQSAAQIADHACQKYSGRVGRSAAAKELDEQAVRLAVIAHIRHHHTRYDSLLPGVGRHKARQIVQPQIQRMLDRWS
jgi:hypothetical protein